ncbi:hypothetical protein BIV25_28440 [Streptomyces sp. MUSC 14]|uniref:hypothetical protein n=1 Tax=Streptomyces sp. MUSC 14 TaxID=1354889 RepID=UPI0008F57FC7|nr:hypothetical protein [Streptomyces sp. MUSC 14]OIJ92229.1 hypothetical protein BIV25_28440 [Streptomyces sp. MUSC 14]
MTMSIIHAFLRWALGLLAPGTGCRRASTGPTTPALAWRPETPRTTAPALPAHRSPYGLHTSLDGEATAMVRPYLLAVERERERAQQYRRRVALVLAADFGIGLDRHVVGAEAVA